MIVKSWREDLSAAMSESGDSWGAVDNGDSSVYGINPVEFWNTHERN